MCSSLLHSLANCSVVIHTLLAATFFPISFTTISACLHVRHHMVIEIVSSSGIISSTVLMGLLPKLAMVGFLYEFIE